MSESSSDSEDFDYNPEIDGASEISDVNDSHSEKQSSESDAELAGKSLKPGKRKRRKRAKAGLKSDVAADSESASARADATAVYDKQRADELWASFLTVKPKPEEKRKPAESSPAIQTASSEKRANGDAMKPINDIAKPPVSCILPTASQPQSASSNSNTVIANAKFETGGGDLRTTANATSGAVKPCASAISAGDQTAPNETAKRKAGIDGVMAFINKKQKLNTLEKSRLDWETFKRDADLKEELATFNRGKTGYLERQAFLNRTDVRVYEQERDMRLKQINKRLGSGGSKLD